MGLLQNSADYKANDVQVDDASLRCSCSCNTKVQISVKRRAYLGILPDRN